MEVTSPTSDDTGQPPSYLRLSSRLIIVITMIMHTSILQEVDLSHRAPEPDHSSANGIPAPSSALLQYLSHLIQHIKSLDSGMNRTTRLRFPHIKQDQGLDPRIQMDNPGHQPEYLFDLFWAFPMFRRVFPFSRLSPTDIHKAPV